MYEYETNDPLSYVIIVPVIYQYKTNNNDNNNNDKYEHNSP